VAQHGEFGRWGVGVYENEYVRENQTWKIASLRLYETMTAPYELGWGVLAAPMAGPSEVSPPDRPPTVDYASYPAAFTPPFHYESPVGGAAVYPGAPADRAEPLGAAGDEAGSVAAVDALERRLTRLEDVDAIDRAQTIYGYYLASNSWDDFSELFAEDGTIEIALRGVYIGKQSVRRSMDLYGQPGTQQGLLHNHMQFQPVVTLSDDGRTAHIRSRAFSIMGQFERYGTWMGGVYENTYQKGADGVWRLAVDRQFNTYFANYDTGWKDLRPGAPPGVSATNPPDRPPTSTFEMYPSAFIVPFHYPNPVTGKTYDGPFTDEAD
jgi:hypothetical protein